MYDRPENAADHDAFWTTARDLLRAEDIDAPDTLDRHLSIWEGWQHPDLLLGQICGLPYRARLHDRLTLIGTADHGLDDTPPGYYRSLFVVRTGDAADIAAYADRMLAVNEALSHSGWAAPWLAARARGFAFRRSVAAGAHRVSARAVADGRADIAAIDAISWRGIVRWEPDVAAALDVIDRTPAAPGLAFVTAAGRESAPIAAAIDAALAAGAGQALGIARMVRIPASDYLAQPIPPAPPGAGA